MPSMLNSFFFEKKKRKEKKRNPTFPDGGDVSLLCKSRLIIIDIPEVHPDGRVSIRIVSCGHNNQTQTTGGFIVKLTSILYSDLSWKQRFKRFKLSVMSNRLDPPVGGVWLHIWILTCRDRYLFQLFFLWSLCFLIFFKFQHAYLYLDQC